MFVMHLLFLLIPPPRHHSILLEIPPLASPSLSTPPPRFSQGCQLNSWCCHNIFKAVREPEVTEASSSTKTGGGLRPPSQRTRQFGWWEGGGRNPPPKPTTETVHRCHQHLQIWFCRCRSAPHIRTATIQRRSDKRRCRSFPFPLWDKYDYNGEYHRHHSLYYSSSRIESDATEDMPRHL